MRCAQAVTNAYMGKQQFYPTVIYLATSKTNMVVSHLIRRSLCGTRSMV